MSPPSAITPAGDRRGRGAARALRCTEDAASLHASRFDAAIFLVKSGATAAAAQALGPALGGAVLLTLPNGMGNAEALSAIPGAVVGRGVTMNAGRYLAPGHVERLIHGQPSWMGPVAPLRPLAEAFRAAGLPTELIEDPMARSGQSSSSTP
jgi:2-dehydropantoate 2-reductase